MYAGAEETDYFIDDDDGGGIFMKWDGEWYNDGDRRLMYEITFYENINEIHGDSGKHIFEIVAADDCGDLAWNLVLRMIP
jgi:hypothetical protein